MRNEHLKFIQQHNLPGGLLRDFVARELWTAACDACEAEIDRCREQVLRLAELKIKLRKEESHARNNQESLRRTD